MKDLKKIAVHSAAMLVIAALLMPAGHAAETVLASDLPAAPAASSAKTPPVNFYAERFYMRPEQKLSFKTTEVDGLVFLQTPNRSRRAAYSIVTDFSGPALRTQYVSGPMNLEELQKWVKENLQKRRYQGVEVKRIMLPSDEGGQKPLYIVGHRAFKNTKEVRQQVDESKSVIEAQGGDFKTLVKEANRYYFPPKPLAPGQKTKAQFQKEEDLMLRYLDQMDIGNELFGPFQGQPSGDRIGWQSFGETSWRLTNLENNAYKSQLGFWTNRVVFKGIKAPFNTIDPYLEATMNLDGTGVDFKSNMVMAAGLEWRPFARSAWLLNTRLWGLPMLTFVRNYRLYIQYEDRKNIKDEITGAKNHDWKGGLGIFYEWGLDLPSISEGAPDTIPEYIRRYIWGEYYGNYYFTHTNFSSEDNVDTFILNSSVILGFKLPGIPLPPNPINDEFVIMPYFRFEHVNNTLQSFHYENRYFVAAGGRWMPFNSYRFKDNEWLAKTKVFVEYVGLGRVKNWRQDEEAPYAVDYDFRVGVSISSKRV